MLPHKINNNNPHKVIHMTPVYHIMLYITKSGMFVRKSIIKSFKFCLNRGEKYAQNKLFSSKNNYNFDVRVDEMLFWWEFNRWYTFFSGGKLWIMDTFSARSKGLTLKSLNDGLIDYGCKHAPFTSQDSLMDCSHGCQQTDRRTQR